MTTKKNRKKPSKEAGTKQTDMILVFMHVIKIVKAKRKREKEFLIKL